MPLRSFTFQLTQTSVSHILLYEPMAVQPFSTYIPSGQPRNLNAPTFDVCGRAKHPCHSDYMQSTRRMNDCQVKVPVVLACFSATCALHPLHRPAYLLAAGLPEADKHRRRPGWLELRRGRRGHPLKTYPAVCSYVVIRRPQWRHSRRRSIRPPQARRV